MKSLKLEGLRLTPQEQQYAKHYMKTHMRLAIVVVIVLCLFVLHLLIPDSLIYIPLSIFDGSLNGVVGGEGLSMFFISICILAYLLPLFQFRFLMQRSGSDLYLSLPIERKRLFYIHYGIGLVFLIACALIELLVMLCFVGSTGNGLNDLSLNTRFVCGIYIVLGVCLYTFFVALIMHCHRILDGVLICIIYTILPLLIYYSLGTFLHQAQCDAMHADTFYRYFTNESVIQYRDIVFMFAALLSIPWQMNCWLDVAYCEPGASSSFLVAALIAWMIVAILCYLHARDKMIRMRSETSGQPTQSLLTYPLLIPILALIFVMAFGGGEIISFSIFMILAVYLLAYCFAQRKLTFDYRNLLVYVAIVLCSSALYHLIGINHWFQTVKEIPEVDEVEYMNVEIQFRSEANEFDYKISEAISDPKVIQEFIQDQEILAKHHEKRTDDEPCIASVTFYYHSQGTVDALCYECRKGSKDQEMIDQMISKWQKKNYLTNPEYFDSIDADME